MPQAQKTKLYLVKYEQLNPGSAKIFISLLEGTGQVLITAIEGTNVIEIALGASEDSKQSLKTFRDALIEICEDLKIE